MNWVFANETRVKSEVTPKTQKMVLDAALLNTQRYKVRIKSKVEQSKKWSCALGVVAIEKGALGSPSTKVTIFTLIYMGPMWLLTILLIVMCLDLKIVYYNNY